MNLEFLSGRSEDHIYREPDIDDPGELRAIDPGAITVGAAVKIVFEIIMPASSS